MHRLTLAGFGYQVPSVLGVGRGLPRLVAEEARPLDGVIPPPLGARQLDLERGPMGRGLGDPLA
jgi:hypothetical protein